MNCKPLLVGIALAAPMLITGCAAAERSRIEITTPPPASWKSTSPHRLLRLSRMILPDDGVDWSCTPVGACGTFTPAHTASGATTVYTAPRTAGPVVITAASTKNPSKNSAGGCHHHCGCHRFGPSPARTRFSPMA